MGIWDTGQDDCYSPSDYKSDDCFWKDGVGSTLDGLFNITEHMAEYEADQEANRIGDNKEIIDYSKGEKVNVD